MTQQLIINICLSLILEITYPNKLWSHSKSLLWVLLKFDKQNYSDALNKKLRLLKWIILFIIKKHLNKTFFLNNAKQINFILFYFDFQARLSSGLLIIIILNSLFEF